MAVTRNGKLYFLKYGCYQRTVKQCHGWQKTSEINISHSVNKIMKDNGSFMSEYLWLVCYFFMKNIF